jgi:uncharacterized protein YukE
VAYDVAARLAEGRPAVADFENFVLAAHVVGYQNPDLTTHAAQVRDLYGTEDGMDLHALASDADALSHLASLARDALQAQAEAMGELASAWQGQAADVAREFLRRHQDSATAVSAAVQEVSGALSSLRDQLWHAVEAKVEATRAIDGRCASARADWLAAAQTVLSGGGDRAVASELVELRVRPFVEGDIGSDWVSAMRTSTDSVSTAYDTAIAAVRPDQLVSFEVPGHLGPAGQPLVASSPARDPHDGTPSVVPSAVQPAVAPTVPAAAVPPTPLAPTSAVQPEVPTAPQAAPSTPGLGDLGAMPALGAGLSGLGRQLTDGIAGLTGAARDALPDEPADEPDEDVETDEKDEADDEQGDQEDEEESNEDGHANLDADPADADRLKSTDALPPPPPPVPTPSPEPLSTDLTPRPPPPARTPCEIAADEVPQVGE